MDKKIWALYTKTVTPLSPEKEENLKKELETTLKEENSPPQASQEEKPQIFLPKRRIPPLEKNSNPLEALDYKKPEKNQKRNMRKGDFPIEAKIDLHGYSIDRAYDALLSFIKSCYETQKRHLLIISGKGRFSYQELENTGVLNKKLPEWFKDSHFANYISVYDFASPKDGGTGAFYVILRKNI